MSMKWKLVNLKGEYASKYGDEITLPEIAEGAGVEFSAVKAISRGTAKRPSLEAVEGILSFFSRKLGRRLDVSDILEYVPE